MATVTVVPTDRSFPIIRLPKIRTRPFLCSLLFVGCDAVAISLAGSAVLLGNRVDGRPDLHHYFSLWPALGIFFAVFAFYDLYPGIIHNAVTELRRLGLALTLGFLVLAVLISVSRLDEAYTRRVLLLSWIASLVVTPSSLLLVSRSSSSDRSHP
jgi:hypothetical protein